MIRIIAMAVGEADAIGAIMIHGLDLLVASRRHIGILLPHRHHRPVHLRHRLQARRQRQHLRLHQHLLHQRKYSLQLFIIQ